MAALVKVIIIVAVSAFQFNSSSGFDATGGRGVVGFELGILTGFVGLILSCIIKTAKYGQGILIGSRVLLLIGFSLRRGGFGLIKKSPQLNLPHHIQYQIRIRAIA